MKENAPVKKGIAWESRIGRRLRLRDLHVLAAVVQSGSMAKAAIGLGVSQPVVSEAIADLEATIGVRLLDRSRRGVTPTLYGQAILNRSRIAFDELRQGIRDIEFLADPTVGEVWIGCSESLTSNLLCSIIDEISGRFPRVRFQVLSVNMLDPRLEFPALRERRIDVVLARAAVPLDAFEYADDLRVEKLFDDHLVVIAGLSSPFAARRRIDLADLADTPWILPANTWNSLRVEEAFRAIGVKMPEIIVDTYSQGLRLQLLATGRFIAAIPASTLRAGVPDDLKLLPVALSDKPWPAIMITLKDRTLSPAAQHFVECARITGRNFTKTATEKNGTRRRASRYFAGK
jgi:DNA-binding transcriptional LysR family regulator